MEQIKSQDSSFKNALLVIGTTLKSFGYKAAEKTLTSVGLFAMWDVFVKLLVSKKSVLIAVAGILGDSLEV